MRTPIWAALIGAAVLTGCASPEKLITSDPPGAAISVNGDPAGVTPAKYNFDFNRRYKYEVAVAREGYIGGSTIVYSGTAAAGNPEIHFALDKDKSWAETLESPACNKWLTIQVLPQFDQADLWKRLVDSVTLRNSDIARMDHDSGYIETAPLTRAYGPVNIRTVVVTKMMTDNKTLSVLFKIVSERSEGSGPFVPWHRVFKEDAQLVEELETRLGVK